MASVVAELNREMAEMAQAVGQSLVQVRSGG